MSPVKSPEPHGARDAEKTNQIVVEKDEADELPPGWTKEVKARKAGSAKKADRYYTDPVTGYIFRSLKDAQRYLKTGKLGRLAIKPKNNEGVDMDNKDESVHMQKREERSESKEQMTEPLMRKRPLDKSELVHIASKRLTPPSPSQPEPKTRQPTHLAAVAVDATPTSPPPSPPDTITETVRSPPSQPEPKTRQAKHLSGINDNAAPPQPNTRRATRQSGIKIDSPPPSPPDTRSSRQATRARLVNLATPKEKDKKTVAEKITNKHGENADMDNNPNHNQEMPTTIHPVNQESHEKQESPVVDPTSSNPIPQNGHSSINFSINDLWTDPCIEFAVKTLTGAIPCGDLKNPENPSPLKVPLEDLWTDPCIEFAVKTLTGAIPVGEDDHLQHRPT